MLPEVRFETCVSPKSDRPLVRADDKVELHASTALRSRVFEWVRTRKACDALPRCCCARHTAAIAYVTPTAGLVITRVNWRVIEP